MQSGRSAVSLSVSAYADQSSSVWWRWSCSASGLLTAINNTIHKTVLLIENGSHSEEIFNKLKLCEKPVITPNGIPSKIRCRTQAGSSLSLRTGVLNLRQNSSSSITESGFKLNNTTVWNKLCFKKNFFCSYFFRQLENHKTNHTNERRRLAFDLGSWNGMASDPSAGAQSHSFVGGLFFIPIGCCFTLSIRNSTFLYLELTFIFKTNWEANVS